MRRALLALSTVALATSVQARVHRIEGATAKGDLCSAALATDHTTYEGAAFQRDPATFPDYATGYDPAVDGSGKTRAQRLRDAIAGTGRFTGGKQINFCLPGVYYPIGYNPATLVYARLAVAGSSASANMPTGCSYLATGGGGDQQGPRILCNGVAFTRSNPIRNVDFTNGGTTCVTLEIINSSGSLLVNNAKWEARPPTAGSAKGGCLSILPGGTKLGFFVKTSSQGNTMTAMDFENVGMDFAPPDCSMCQARGPIYGFYDYENAAHSLHLGYFYSLRIPGRLINMSGSVGPQNLTADHFYIEGISQSALELSIHGEINVANASGIGSTQQYSDGVFVIPRMGQEYGAHGTTYNGRGLLTTAVYFADGITTNTYANVQLDHALVISNATPPTTGYPNGRSQATGATEISYDKFSASDHESVWIDPNGFDQCIVALSAAGGLGAATGVGVTSPTFGSTAGVVTATNPSGAPNPVVDLYDGSVVTGFDGGTAHGQIAACNGHSN